MERRSFLAALAALAAPEAAGVQRPEVGTYWAEVPPGATLWGLVVFAVDEPVEFTIAAGKEIKTIRGQFDVQRLKEYAWRNTSSGPARVGIRARAMAGDRELTAQLVQYLSEQNVYVGFGRRGTPDTLEDRKGVYPFYAVFVGFITFGA